MSQFFRESAHLRTDPEKYSEGWDRIFGKKEDKPQEETKEDEDDKDPSDTVRRID